MATATNEVKDQHNLNREHFAKPISLPQVVLFQPTLGQGALAACVAAFQVVFANHHTPFLQG
jgi:hypothetical protein